MAHHVPACSSRRDEEWGRLLVEEREGAPLYVIRLYGGGLWNEAGPRVQVRTTLHGAWSGRRQQGVVQQLTNGSPRACRCATLHGAGPGAGSRVWCSS